MKNRLLLLTFCLEISLPAEGAFGMPLTGQGLRINEIVSSNSTGLVDEDGDYPDWVELYNAGPDTIDLSGFGLTDNSDSPFKWIFPEIILMPDRYLLIFASGKDRRAAITAWETVIDWGDAWVYSYNNGEPPAGWKNTGFDASGWSVGASGFGYGDDDDATIVGTTMAVYLRKTFTPSETALIEAAVLHVDYDDAFVAYLNGFEIARANIGTPGVPPLSTQGADTWREAAIYQGGRPEAFVLEEAGLNLLSEENVLAIQVHNYDLGSSDLTLIPFLSVGYSASLDQPGSVNSILDLPEVALHTNFKISSAGEFVALTSADGQLIDSLSVPALTGDMSWGRDADNPDTWLIYASPTPGVENGSGGYQGIVEKPELSHAADFYPSPISVTITGSNPEVRIYYTTDGSDPQADGMLYTDPIELQNTTVLRAGALQTGFLPSEVVTHSYLINENTLLPVVSLSTNPANFWDADTGIYVMGPGADPNFPYFGANFWQDWERPIHMEFFEPGSPAALSTGMGVKIFGQWSRANAQRSMALYARAKYGSTAIDYPFFPEQPDIQYEALVLRNSGNDWGVTMLRDALMTGLAQGLGLDLQAYRPVVVFLNGEYWGIHNLREKINEHFIAAHHNIDADDMDIIENNLQVVHGNDTHYENLLDFIESNDITKTAVYRQAEDMIAVDNFIKYQSAQIYFDNTDWPGNNIKYWRSQVIDGRWRWILYDTDFGFGLFDPYSYSNNTLNFALEANGPGWPNPPWSTYLLRRLLQNMEFRNRYILTTCDLLNEYFSVGSAFEKIGVLKDVIADEIPAHVERWGGSFSQWRSNVAILEDFALYRPAYARQHLQERFDLADPVPVYLTAQPGNGGRLQINSLTINDFPWTGIYFADLPISVTAIPNSGYSFAGWDGLVTSGESTISILPGVVDTVRALFTPDTTMPSIIVINEINYNSPDFAEAGDWVELYNASSLDLDMGGWKLKDSDDTHTYTIPAGAQLTTGAFLVLCEDTSQFRQIHGNGQKILGNFDFGYSGSGETVRVYDQTGYLVDSVTYDDSFPWPLAPDGTGPTLELINPNRDNARPENWASSNAYGSPGRLNDSYLSVSEYVVGLLPQEIRLYQNYPNPFNQATVINYALPEMSHVSLTIYDVRGRKVAELFDGIDVPGIRELAWSGRNDSGHPVSSGVYFYRLQVENKVFNRKLILIK